MTETVKTKTFSTVRTSDDDRTVKNVLVFEIVVIFSVLHKRL